MRRLNPMFDDAAPGPIPWAIQIRAVSPEEPSHLARALTGAILGCGGWVLSRGVNDSGTLNLVFEFERRISADIYTVLLATGVELSPYGHRCFTDLCQCTRFQDRKAGAKIASVDLEVQLLSGDPDAESPSSYLN